MLGAAAADWLRGEGTRLQFDAGWMRWNGRYAGASTSCARPAREREALDLVQALKSVPTV